MERRWWNSRTCDGATVEKLMMEQWNRDGETVEDLMVEQLWWNCGTEMVEQ